MTCVCVYIYITAFSSHHIIGRVVVWYYYYYYAYAIQCGYGGSRSARVVRTNGWTDWLSPTAPWPRGGRQREEMIRYRALTASSMRGRGRWADRGTIRHVYPYDLLWYRRREYLLYAIRWLIILYCVEMTRSDDWSRREDDR